MTTATRLKLRGINRLHIRMNSDPGFAVGGTGKSIWVDSLKVSTELATQTYRSILDSLGIADACFVVNISCPTSY
jgi:hypothetical protein